MCIRDKFRADGFHRQLRYPRQKFLLASVQFRYLHIHIGEQHIVCARQTDVYKRQGLACLIPMIIGLVGLMSMMTGTGMKFFEEYQRAGERISAEATEYVRGLSLIHI